MERSEVRRVITEQTCDRVVRAVDLRRAGVTDKEVLVARRAGELTRQLQGIYTSGTATLDALDRDRVALAHAGPGSVLTGLRAAELLGLRWTPTAKHVHVLVAPDRRRATTVAWVTVRRCSWVEQIPVTLLWGLPVAPVAQVLVDAARELTSLQDVRGLVLAAVADRRTTVKQVREVLARSAPGGTALVRRACLDAERGCVSPPEAELVDAFLPAGKPFYVNCEVYVGAVLLGVVDLWIVGAGTGAEVDSELWHGARDLLDATLERDGRFRHAGLSLEHVMPARLRAAPPAFVRTLLEEVARRERLGLREPAALLLRPRGPLLGA